MKKQKTLFIALAIIIFIGILLFNKNSSERKDTVQVENSSFQENGQMCFLYEQEVPIELAGDFSDAYNREYIELTIKEDSNVAGIHNIIPFGTDSNFATLIGVTDGKFVNIIATANAEGTTWREQRLYLIQEDKLLVGYQPVYVPRYENENGIFMYEDINKIIFETEEFYLPKVDCESVDRSLVL